MFPGHLTKLARDNYSLQRRANQMPFERLCGQTGQRG